MKTNHYEGVASSTSATTREPLQSPISVLPPEVHSLVFEFAFTSEGIKASVILCKVSKLWHKLALENPLLWTRLTISLPYDLEAIAKILARSKSCLIDLRLIVPYSHQVHSKQTVSPPRIYERLSGLLSGPYGRCRIPCIQGIFRNSDYTLVELLSPLRTLSMPHLEQFELNGKDVECAELPESATRLFTEAPRLRKVALGGYGLLNYTVPLSQVTTLHLIAPKARYTYEALTPMLQSCPLLTFLAIYDDLLPADWHSAHSGACHLPQLQSLFVLGTMMHVSELLLYLRAPDLRELVISPMTTDDLGLFHSDHDPSAPRFPQLQSLTLSCTKAEFLPVVVLASACFPGVTRLVLPDIYPKKFEKAFGNPEMQLFPSVRKLAVQNVQKNFLSSMNLVSTLRGTNQPWIDTLYMDIGSILRADPEQINPDGHYNLIEADIWEEQRQKALYTDGVSRFASSMSWENT